MKFGKKYADSIKAIDRSKLYDSNDALALVCQTAKAKFDETVELHVRLGVDPRKANQMVRGVVTLPHGTGKEGQIVNVNDGYARNLGLNIRRAGGTRPPPSRI